MLLSAEQAAAGRVRVYRNVTVMDGTPGDGFFSDVAVEGTRIVLPDTDQTFGELPEGAIDIDGTGLVLAPGFVDMHAHSDIAVLRGADHTAKLLQGVTTEVVGQDGLGYSPVTDETAHRIAKQIAGWNGPIDANSFTWRTMGEYLSTVDPLTAGNVAALVPQGNLRMAVVGFEARPATPAELVEMGEILAAALDDGAFGMSSGLTYTPGMYADTAELEALCRIVAERGGYWAPHTRSYGGAALEAYTEAIEIGRRTGCPIHLTHATMNFAPNRGRAAELLQLIDDAVASGVDVTLDTYPYLPGATTLSALLPSSFAPNGDLMGALTGLDPERREWLRIQVDEVGCDGFHGEVAEWDRIQISGVENQALADIVGKTITEIATERGATCIDTVVDILITDDLATGILMHVGDEDNVRAIMTHPRHSGGSDGILVGARPHPRAFGAFARYLGHYVRDEQVLTLGEAIAHLSTNPARRLGLHRGDAPRCVIRTGAIADLLLFDPTRVAAGATFEHPRTPPIGILEVLVAGTLVVKDGALTGALPGAALRHAPAAHHAVFPAPHMTLHAPGTQDLADIVLRGADELTVAQELLGAPSPAATPVRVTIDESLSADAYRVEISSSGVSVAGGDAAGAFRGALVLDQLRDPDEPHTPVPFGTWSGAPALGWRGLMLDVARHFRPVDDVIRVIDLMARHGLNTLHLHLTDDQGWRYDVPGWPELTALGAVREGTQLGHGPRSTVDDVRHAGFYTGADLERIAAHARSRHVTVVPEVEFPGHVQAALAAYPALATATGIDIPTTPWERFGLNPHTLNLEPGTLQFCFDAIDALCAAFEGEFIGIGGDEVPTAQWAASERVAERMAELGLENVSDVQPWFTAKLAEHLRARGRRAFAWDEVLAGPVPEDVLIGAWRGAVAADVSLRRGHEVIACADTDVYLDYRQSESMDEPVPVGPPLTVEDVAAYRIPAGARGAQANVWTEHLRTRDEVDFAMFPRLAVLADRFWRGGEAADVRDTVARLNTHLRRLRAWGVAYRSPEGPTAGERKDGVPGVPRTRAERAAIVAELVADLE